MVSSHGRMFNQWVPECRSLLLTPRTPWKPDQLRPQETLPRPTLSVFPLLSQTLFDRCPLPTPQTPATLYISRRTPANPSTALPASKTTFAVLHHTVEPTSVTGSQPIRSIIILFYTTTIITAPPPLPPIPSPKPPSTHDPTPPTPPPSPLTPRPTPPPSPPPPSNSTSASTAA